ncbi:uncharacterized protein DEA37_0008239 [Paragonimus westermani]|uniref:Uncharacterized protein n=1 Tax=Paragonimus westermani TaxID=34504 RepID=A0A5J4NDS3_9TREM|nr:uncharacterized protein DEA37_0008239 [Paragonimus westermani]
MYANLNERFSRPCALLTLETPRVVSCKPTSGQISVTLKNEYAFLGPPPSVLSQQNKAKRTRNAEEPRNSVHRHADTRIFNHSRTNNDVRSREFSSGYKGVTYPVRRPVADPPHPGPSPDISWFSSWTNTSGRNGLQPQYANAGRPAFGQPPMTQFREHPIKPFSQSRFPGPYQLTNGDRNHYSTSHGPTRDLASHQDSWVHRSSFPPARRGVPRNPHYPREITTDGDRIRSSVSPRNDHGYRSTTSRQVWRSGEHAPPFQSTRGVQRPNLSNYTNPPRSGRPPMRTTDFPVNRIRPRGTADSRWRVRNGRDSAHVGTTQRSSWFHDNRWETPYEADRSGLRRSFTRGKESEFSVVPSPDEYIDDFNPEDLAKYKLEINMDGFIVHSPTLSDPILTIPLSKWHSDELRYSPHWDPVPTVNVNVDKQSWQSAKPRSGDAPSSNRCPGQRQQQLSVGGYGKQNSSEHLKNTSVVEPDEYLLPAFQLWSDSGLGTAPRLRHVSGDYQGPEQRWIRIQELSKLYSGKSWPCLHSSCLTSTGNSGSQNEFRTEGEPPHPRYRSCPSQTRLCSNSSLHSVVVRRCHSVNDKSLYHCDVTQLSCRLHGHMETTPSCA